MSGQKDFTGECHFYIKLPEVKDHMYRITGEVNIQTTLSASFPLIRSTKYQIVTVSLFSPRLVVSTRQWHKSYYQNSWFGEQGCHWCWWDEETLERICSNSDLPWKGDATSNKPTIFSHKERYLQSHVPCNGKEQIFKLRSNKCRRKSRGVANANPQWQSFLL